MKDGFLIIDKAGAMTSHDVVAIARRALSTRKVGHAGTLDPMATGVLVLGFGNGTRLLQYITDGDKSYRATIRLGIATITDDKDGEIISQADCSHIKDGEITSELAKMQGTFMQRPAQVSAVKVAGKRAYDRVRDGEDFQLAAREVTISHLEIVGIHRSESGISIEIDVTCSAGTFIRSIARDLGEALGVGGHLTSLRRTRVAGFSQEMATSCEDLKAGKYNPLDLAAVARATFEVRELNSAEVAELSFGRPLAQNSTAEITAALSADNQLIALLKNVSGKAKPVAVFAAAH